MTKIEAIDKSLHEADGVFLYPAQDESPVFRVTLKQFKTIKEWRNHLASLSISSDLVPADIRREFEEAIGTLFFAWVDRCVVMSAELRALSILEMALKRKFYDEKFSGLGAALSYAVKHDGLDERIAKALRMARNSMAHGGTREEHKFGEKILVQYVSPPNHVGGLFEIIRYVIERTYRFRG